MDLTIFATCGLVPCLAWLAWYDTRQHRLPDAGTLPLILAGLLLSTVPGGPNFGQAALGAMIAFGLFFGLGALYFSRRGIDGLGLGDAKLFAAAGAWLGWSNLPVTLLGATLPALAFALVTGRTGMTRFAFGPFICLSFLSVWIFTRILS